MRAPATLGRGSVALAGLALGLLFVVPAAGVAEAEPPKSFNLWVGKWVTPYGVLTLKPTTAAVPPDTVKRPAISGTFSKGGTLLGRLNTNRGDAGDLSNTNVTGTYRIPNAGSGQFRIGIDTSEGSTTAFRAFTFNAFGGQAATFTAPYVGGGPSVADLERSFVAAAPTANAGGTLYTVRWHYKAKLIGPSALPKPGLLLKFRYSRPISPLHFALGPPNAGFLQHIWGCSEVRNAARTAKLGFDCETFSLGPRHDVGTGWLVDATFSATVPAGSPPISATISNTETDKFAHLPAKDRTVLHAGRSIPKRPGTGPAFSWTGTWSWTATVGGRVFREQGMSIVQQGRTACSSWPFSSGGTAKGALSANQRTWGPANWYDGYGKGQWTLTLESNNRFTGTQLIDPHSAAEGANYSARIEGTRTSTRPARSLDCSTIRVGP